MTGPGDHYFTARPGGRSVLGTVTVGVAGQSFTLATDAGVFSRDRLDPGTRVLLDHLGEPPADGDLLDLGCGYGPIACVLAMLRPSTRVWAVDVNERAVELTRRNAEALGLANVRACAPDGVPATARLAGVYSNPPIRVGKQALHGLLLRWLGALEPRGQARLVVQRNLGADSLATWLRGQGYGVRRMASQRGYRVLAVSYDGDTQPPSTA